MSFGRQVNDHTQTSSFRRSLFAFLTGLSLSSVLLIGGSITPPLAFAAHGQPLTNLGFESGPGSIPSWSVSAADSASVLDTDTFPKDKDSTETVSPYLGNYMARLGSPMLINEKQPRGDNKITQTFESNGNKIIISFRLFSWEHRGDDTFTLDLRDTNGNGFPITGFSIPMTDGSTKSCSQTPCDVTLDVGKRGEFLDSDWVIIEIDTAGTAGTDLTLEYNIHGGDNEAHASWVYFDDVNTPPVAKFDYTPKGDTEFPIIEGDFVTFNDQSYDPDAGDYIDSWEWTITGLGYTETFTDKEGVLI